MLDPMIQDKVNQMLEEKGQGYVRLNTFFQVKTKGSYYSAVRKLGLSGCSSVRRRVEELQEELELDRPLVWSDGTGLNFCGCSNDLYDFLKPFFGGD